MKYTFPILLLFAFSLVVGCKKKGQDKDDPTPAVLGCNDPSALNYNAAATQNDGNCQFADKFLPLAIGNYWQLQDTVNVPIPGFELTLPVAVDLNIDKDTVMDGKTYFMMTQSVAVEGSPIPVGDVFPTTRFGYRTDRTGKIWRKVPGDTEEYVFINYPLTVGDSWEDQSSSPATYTVTGTQLMWVPAAGKSVSAWKIQVVSGGTGGQPIELYVSKDIGLVRQEIAFNVMGFDIGLDAFLQTLDLK